MNRRRYPIAGPAAEGIYTAENVNSPFQMNQGSYRIPRPRSIVTLLVLSFCPKPARFHSITAEVHVAPPPSLILTCVQKQPPAFSVVAGSDLDETGGRGQSGRLQRKNPDRKFSLLPHLGPGPFEAVATPSESLMLASSFNVFLQRLHAPRSGPPAIDYGIEEIGKDLA